MEKEPIEKQNYREKGRLVSGRDSGGRFQRPPSVYWHKHECLNYLLKCQDCCFGNKGCSQTGTYEEIFVRDSTGDYTKRGED